ncbi:DUF4232 domain-containing protein [Streptomyces sp. NPDC005423]|uniref:DUF4232 domain-containing protein n=1 Tax=Streptomyces sp. NPDC005423 TaxID=3155343 RepID=UPI00339E7C80
MTNTSQSPHRTALLASAVAVLGLLTACGNDSGPSNAPRAPRAPSAARQESFTTGASGPRSAPASATTTTTPVTSKSATGSGTATGGRCHTSALRASVGRDDPGAGQENFPLVLTNTSGRTCTLRGFPGAAFVDASGKQLGPDPRRESGTPATVTLKPGRSAWAGLTFSNPGVSGAKTATPASLVITPPDERDPLKVRWTGGAVPVSGNSSSVFLTVFAAGTGA